MRLPLALATATAAVWSAPALACHIPAVAAALGVPRRGEGRGVALTFDDGPHIDGTPAVLDVLQRAGAIRAWRRRSGRRGTPSHCTDSATATSSG